MKINYKKLSKIILIITIIILLLTIFLKVKIYFENNKIMNRTLYVYTEKQINDSKQIQSIEKKHIGCYKDGYIIQSYESIINNLLYGNKPENSSDILITKKYCEEQIINKNGMKIIDNCSKEILNKSIIIDDKEMNIVGIINSRDINPNIYLNLKSNNTSDSYQYILVSEDNIRDICKNEDSYYKIVFKNYKSLEKYSKDLTKSYYISDIYIRPYMQYLYFLCGIMIVINIILVIKRRKNGVN